MLYVDHPELDHYLEITYAVIAAHNNKRVIGKDNTIPWRVPEDLRAFKMITMGAPMIMGRKTFESLPGVLPGRHHVILSRNSEGQESKPAISWASDYEKATSVIIDEFVKHYKAKDEEKLKHFIGKQIKFSGSLDAVLSMTKTKAEVEKKEPTTNAFRQARTARPNAIKMTVFYVGGGQVYQDVIGEADIAFITEINNDVDGDAFFPVMSSGWSLKAQSDVRQSEGPTGEWFTDSIWVNNKACETPQRRETDEEMLGYA